MMKNKKGFKLSEIKGKESFFIIKDYRTWPFYNLFINQFLANVPILYPLKTPENQRFFGVFRGYKMGTLARNGLKESPVFST